MKVDVKAFLALDSTAGAIIAEGWKPEAERVIAELHPLLEAGKWQSAHAAIDKLDMKGIVEQERPRLEELATSALLFGAHHVTGDITTVSYVSEGKKLPHQIGQAIDQLRESIENDVADMLRKALHHMVDALKQAPVSTFKADDGQDPDLCNCSVHLSARLTKAADFDLAAMLNANVMDGSKVLIDVGATLTTSRLINLGFLSEASHNDFDTYRIDEVLDGVTCPVCRYMNGKVFKVQHELGKTLTAIGTQDPADLKSIAPWPSNSKSGLQDLMSKSNEELQASGLGSPPFHPNCRGILTLVPNEKAREQDDDPDVDPNEAADAAAAFQQLIDLLSSKNVAAEELSAAELTAASEEIAAGVEPEIVADKLEAETYVKDKGLTPSDIHNPDLSAAVDAIEDKGVQAQILQAFDQGDKELAKKLLEENDISTEPTGDMSKKAKANWLGNQVDDFLDDQDSKKLLSDMEALNAAPAEPVPETKTKKPKKPKLDAATQSVVDDMFAAPSTDEGDDLDAMLAKLKAGKPVTDDAPKKISLPKAKPAKPTKAKKPKIVEETPAPAPAKPVQESLEDMMAALLKPTPKTTMPKPYKPGPKGGLKLPKKVVVDHETPLPDVMQPKPAAAHKPAPVTVDLTATTKPKKEKLPTKPVAPQKTPDGFLPLPDTDFSGYIPVQSYAKGDAALHKEEWRLQEKYLDGNTLSKPVKDAFKRYSGSAFRPINESLRIPGYGEPTDNIKSLIKNLDEGMSKSATRSNQTMYRGVGPEFLRFNPTMLTPGAVIEDKGFMSTSYDRVQSAQGFGSSGYVFDIRVPKGTPGVVMNGGKEGTENALSIYPHEHELLLARGTKMQILAVDGRNITAVIVP